MDWLSHVRNADFLRSVFDGRAPSLDAVDLHEVRFEREAATATLRFDLREFPSQPPKAWAGKGCNVVQIQVMAIGITCCHLKGWSPSLTGRMTIERAADVRLEFAGEGCALMLGAEHLRVHAVSAYLRQH